MKAIETLTEVMYFLLGFFIVFANVGFLSCKIINNDKEIIKLKELILFRDRL